MCSIHLVRNPDKALRLVFRLSIFRVFSMGLTRSVLLGFGYVAETYVTSSRDAQNRACDTHAYD